MSKYQFRHRNFQPGDPADIAHAWLLYDIAKYYFEFVRNLVGSLYFIASKTHSILLGIVALVSTGVLLMQIQSFMTSWNMIVFLHIWPGKRGLLLDYILNIVLTLVLAVGSIALVIYSVSLISAAQFR